jgi:2-amino-4-hydroxy-6-hydroxymethyldihydropteridine diphosphokinase
MTSRVYIALGANVGDRERSLSYARAAIDALPDTRLVGESLVEETAPFGPVPQPPFLNQMLAVETMLEPEPLLVALHAIERAAGRTRESEIRWGPRTLDCDIVLFGDRVIATDTLTVPHPGVADRYFWRRELTALGVDVAAIAHESAAR